MPGATPPPIQGSPPGGSAVSLPDNTPTRIEMTKPAGASTPGAVANPNPFPATLTTRPTGGEVRPAAGERPPQTSFDVDLYEPRAGDTYETIAREFYNDTRYARALQEFNARQPVQTGRTVNVPPISVLRQRYSGMIGATPASRSGTSPTPTPAPASEWGPASPPKSDGTPAFRPAGGSSQTFRVPPGGMSLKAVARQTLGTEQRWGELYNLNPQVADPNAVPAGTTLKLPADARLSP
jgi:nucleoid-associated protein YgaU